MTYKLVNATEKNAMRLQGIGFVQGFPAADIKKGDMLLWNFGDKSTVIDILKDTGKMIIISTISQGKIYERKLAKKRLVCILQ